LHFTHTFILHFYLLSFFLRVAEVEMLEFLAPSCDRGDARVGDVRVRQVEVTHARAVRADRRDADVAHAAVRQSEVRQVRARRRERHQALVTHLRGGRREKGRKE